MLAGKRNNFTVLLLVAFLRFYEYLNKILFFIKYAVPLS